MKRVVSFFEAIGMPQELIGGKGLGLAEMVKLGIPVPPGFIVTTEACKEFYKDGQIFSKSLQTEILNKLKILEIETKKTFGGRHNPLLVSVRSGAPVSMPGMMDTILNLGLNDETIKGHIELCGDEKIAYKHYKRFIEAFGVIALGMKKENFKNVCTHSRGNINNIFDEIRIYKDLIQKESGKEFPSDVYDQLFLAIKAVFNSWFNPRAITYRQAYNIPEDMGTAAIVQTMVFGDLGSNSGTGVAFTRDPSTGEKTLFGEFLLNAQGEELVSGTRTPTPLYFLREEFPEIYNELAYIAEVLESYFKDMQDIEFTIENSKLYILQTRSGKRTAVAAAKIAYDMYKEGKISKQEALKRICSIQSYGKFQEASYQIDQVNLIANGLPASPGIATGKVVFDSDRALDYKNKNEKVILVRHQTSPEDIRGMLAAEGILTAHGGLTCHAAVVARGMGKPCVVGCEKIEIDYEKRLFLVRDKNVAVKEGDVISIDGTTGNVMIGEVPKQYIDLNEYIFMLLKDLSNK